MVNFSFSRTIDIPSLDKPLGSTFEGQRQAKLLRVRALMDQVELRSTAPDGNKRTRFFVE